MTAVWLPGHCGLGSGCHFQYSVSPLVSSMLTGFDISREEEEDYLRELGSKTEYLPLKSIISSGDLD